MGAGWANGDTTADHSDGDNWGPKVQAKQSNGQTRKLASEKPNIQEKSSTPVPKLKFKTETSFINYKVPKSRGAPMFTVDIESGDQVIPLTVCDNDDPQVLPKLLTYIYPDILKTDVNWEASFTDFLTVNMKKTRA
jgi:hypothetical protein